MAAKTKAVKRAGIRAPRVDWDAVHEELYSAPAGSSPALRIACPVCGAGTGAYCLKNGRNEVQVIAHKKRREEEERTR